MHTIGNSRLGSAERRNYDTSAYNYYGRAVNGNYNEEINKGAGIRASEGKRAEQQLAQYLLDKSMVELLSFTRVPYN